MTARVFVSYARNDGETFAADLAARIEAKGIPVWRDREGLRGNDGWWRQIERVLREIEYLVVVLTPGAVESETVRKEWHLARREGVCIYPVIASGDLAWKNMPLWISKGHCYDLKFQEQKFFNDLNTRCITTCVPFMAEDLPDNHVPRPQLFDGLAAMMLDENRGRPKAITTALRGAGGFGKTTLAREFCHDIRTRYLFYDGILWVTLGEKPVDLTAKLDDLIYALEGKRSDFSDAAAAATHLRELLEEKHALIVIDDVWHEADARPFLVGGPGCTWLMTTRLRETLPRDATEIAVDEMANDEAVAVLGAGVSNTERATLSVLASRLGEWPLLLRLVNRVIADRVRRRAQTLNDAISFVNQKLDHQGLVAFDLANATARDQAVAKTLAVSLEALESFGANALTRFESLAVFPEDANVPVAVVARLWGVAEFDASELCDRLFSLSLLYAYDLSAKTIRLHDVIRAYLRQRVGSDGERGLHRRLVASYRASCNGQWHLLPNDGYAGDHLARHLAESNDRESLDGLLNSDWKRAQLARVGSDRAFGADADVAISASLEEPRRDVSLVRSVYVRAAIGARATRIPPETLGAMAALGQHQRAMDEAAFIHDPGKRSSAFRLIGAALTRRGLSSEARRAFDCAYDSIQGLDLPAHELSALSRALVDAGDIERAKVVAREAAKAARRPFRSDLFDSARALIKCGELVSAAEVAQPMIDWKEDMDVGDLFCVAHIFEHAEHPARGQQTRTLAIEKYQQMREQIRAGTGPNFYYLADVIAALCESGELERAAEALHEWPMLHRLATFGRAILDTGDTDTANDVVNEILERVRTSPNEKLREFDRLCSELTSDTIVDLFFLLTSLDRGDEASALAAVIKDADFRSEAFGTIAAAGVEKQWEGASDALEASLAASRTPDRLAPAYVQMMRKVITALVRHGRRKEAQRVIQDFNMARPTLNQSADDAASALADFAAAATAVNPAAAALTSMAPALASSFRKLVREKAAQIISTLLPFTKRNERMERGSPRVQEIEEVMGIDPQRVSPRVQKIKELIAIDPQRAQTILEAWPESNEDAIREELGVTIALARAFERRGQPDRSRSVARHALAGAQRVMHAWNAQPMGDPAEEYLARCDILEFTNHAAEAAAMLKEDVDMIPWALAATDRVVDKHRRAEVLVAIAQAVASHGLREQAMHLTIEAFLIARHAGRDTVMEVFGDCADILANTDGGETLWCMYKEIRGVDMWMCAS